MIRTDADKIINRLTDGCEWNRFDRPGVQAEYQKALLKYSYDQMNSAVDILLESDSKNVPLISALVKVCRGNKSSAIEITNPEYCEVCDDKGYVIMTEYRKFTDEISIPYQYVLYCPFCPVGQSQAYDGRTCKEKSPYFCPPLTQYFDDEVISQMRQINRDKKERSHKLSREEIDEIQAKFTKFGLKMPALKPHETERGDAWEGDAPCPF